MKNRIGRILVCFLSLILSCVLFMPKINSYANAEESSDVTVEAPKYTLIGSDFTEYLEGRKITSKTIMEHQLELLQKQSMTFV